jgi:hypothetical protein
LLKHNFVSKSFEQHGFKNTIQVSFKSQTARLNLNSWTNCLGWDKHKFISENISVKFNGWTNRIDVGTKCVCFEFWSNYIMALIICPLIVKSMWMASYFSPFMSKGCNNERVLIYFILVMACVKFVNMFTFAFFFILRLKYLILTTR